MRLVAWSIREVDFNQEYQMEAVPSSTAPVKHEVTWSALLFVHGRMDMILGLLIINFLMIDSTSSKGAMNISISLLGGITISLGFS
ncbi:hypothetical protein H5410_062563 [Solanum commersonii]|uniref:Uncharacterized protein n=1 Tax=Solanum commersonii TaxID=4109 RepID=A0A9J5WB81_SOLCO|nr:hypothetical protein H5410_062563 [Solanum commersonii]